MNILQMFSYPFMQRALIAGVLVSLCAALLGVPLVLKRYSMIGDGLSHVSFGALAIAVALGLTPLYFSIPVVILAALTCAETTHTELEVGGIYYGETQRKDGKIVSAKLYDVTVLYQLSGLVGGIRDSQTAEEVFRQLIWMSEHREG